MPVDPRLVYVDMKTRRAQFHLDTLEVTVKNWIDSKPYTVIHDDNFEKAVHIVRIEDEITPELIPMSLGDFVCCLRAALDQLAWALRVRTLSEREQRQVQFPIAKVRDATYEIKRALFPPAVADDIDSFQPYLRGDSFSSDPLWQLNELWTMDKHRAIPCNSNSFNLNFPFQGWQRYLRHFTNAIEVHFPIAAFYEGPMNLEPEISVEILFGEHMGEFEVSMGRLREINDFVGKRVIPRFTRFFA
ncbi:MAG TPA: hypothetical protein VN777_10505 [Terriglobales bacterium]|nr:hypothetical protein [Terriglobales bacterium]